MGMRNQSTILDKNHAIPITNCLTTFGCIQYTVFTGDGSFP